MFQITNLSANAHQQTTVLLEDKSAAVVSLNFYPRTQKWNIDVTHKTFSAKGIGLCIHPNLLRAFRNNLPFGIACYAEDGVDPFDITDFDTGRVKLYLLDSTGGVDEVGLVESGVF